MADLSETRVLKVVPGKPMSAEEVLEIVYKANKEKGYDAVNQITGYLVSDDPTYITSYNDARKTVRKLERDEIIEELISAYVKSKGWD
ncbi:MAG: IreB family regulatory phosphoprotein [Lachnospiraceae bacterium]|nr:IreB family regulatory phosphoprotein [Lachnospiraceae bacterium]